MKKILIILFLLTPTIYTYSQNFSYGPLLGGNFNQINIRSGSFLEGISRGGGISIGSFGDYQVNQSFGIKSNLIFNIFFEKPYYEVRGDFSANKFFDKITIYSLQLQSFLKYDLDSNYNKGLHLLGGFNVVNTLKENPRKDYDLIKDFYKNISFGVITGVGTSLSTNLQLELITKFGLTDVIKSELSQSKNFGVYLNFSYYVSSNN